MSTKNYSPTISDSAVLKATGHNWKFWFDFLDSLQARSYSHKEIVEMLAREAVASLPESTVSSWWQQSIVVEYEYYIGRRVKGQTANTGWQVGATRIIPASQLTLWEFLLSNDGLKLWLGKVTSLDLQKGSDYKTQEGSAGQIRSVAEPKRIRLTWNHPTLAKEATLQLYLVPKPGKNPRTSLNIHLEKLSSAKEREAMKKHWKGVLAQIYSFFADSKV